jgi:hypothetical protein
MANEIYFPEEPVTDIVDLCEDEKPDYMKTIALHFLTDRVSKKIKSMPEKESRQVMEGMDTLRDIIENNRMKDAKLILTWQLLVKK